MGRADDQTAVEVEEPAWHPVELDRDMGATIDEGSHHPIDPKHESRDGCAPVMFERETYALATLGQRCGMTDQACRLSHWCKPAG